MLMEVVGTTKVDFTNREGNQIIGLNVFVNYASPNVNGLCADKIFIGTKIKTPEIVAGNNYDFDFDRKGRLVSVSESEGFA